MTAQTTLVLGAKSVIAQAQCTVTFATTDQLKLGNSTAGQHNRSAPPSIASMLLSTPQLSKQSRGTLWLVSCQG